MNKAHTATVNRIKERYGLPYNGDNGFDFQCDQFVIEVETTATVKASIERLAHCDILAYVAMTNLEGVRDALRMTAGTPVGVMDPKGTIMKEPAAP